MSELSILELETEHAELLPEREALSLVHGGYVGGHNHVEVTQVAFASAHSYSNTNEAPTATATNVAIVAVG
jgi:7-keto-8-aminopelargonate synthetase-like enzyme